MKHGQAKSRKNTRGSVAVRGRTSSKTSTASLPPTSFKALPLETSIGSSSKNGPSAPEGKGLSGDRKVMEPKKIQSKCGEENATSVKIHSQSRMAASATETAPSPEPIEPDGNVEEVVDLTCEPTMVDLTHNDSVVFVGEIRQCPNAELRVQLLSDTYILCSDDDSERGESDTPIASKLSSKLKEETVGSSGSSGTVSCPICMDNYAEIVHSGRLIVSTSCGHVFCSLCLDNSLRSVKFCPTCRKKLNNKQYHPIYI